MQSFEMLMQIDVVGRKSQEEVLNYLIVKWVRDPVDVTMHLLPLPCFHS